MPGWQSSDLGACVSERVAGNRFAFLPETTNNWDKALWESLKMLASGLRIVIPGRQATSRRSLRAPVYGLERTSHWTHRGNPGRVQFSPYALLCSRRCGREWGIGITGQHATGERAVSKGSPRAASGVRV